MRVREWSCRLALLWIAATACVGVGAVPVGTVPWPEAKLPSALEQKLEQGRQAMVKRDYARADALFNEAAALDRRSPLPMLSLAESARVRGDAAAAKQWLTKALEIAPKHAQTLRAWGHWHYATAEYPKAVEYWQAALKADPKATGALMDLGDYHFNVLARLDEAAKFYQRALAIDPKHAGAHYALGMARLREGKLDEAESRLAEAARLSPANPLPLVGSAQVRVQRRDAQGALDLYDQALKKQPTYYAARLDKADLLLATGRAEQALGEYKAVASAHPNVAAAHVGAGVAHQHLKRDREALDNYQAALRIDDKHVIALNNAAWLASERADVADRGLAWALKAAELAPNEPRVLGTLAWVRHRRGDSVSAQEQLETLVSGAGKRVAESHYLLAKVSAERGDKQRAVAALREALKLNPHFPDAPAATAELKRLSGGG